MEQKMVKKAVPAILLAIIALFACNSGEESDKGAAQNEIVADAGGVSDENTSYAFGMALGSDLKQTGVQFNYDAFIQGFKESIEGKETRISRDEAIQIIQTAFMSAMANQAEENKAKETQFLAENGKKDGIQTTPSGLQYEIITQGSGVKPGAGDTVSVHYEGTLIDGTVFDSSYERGEPSQFPLGGVIPGWTEGIQLMNVGSTYRLFIPSALAYGEQGAGSSIPPNSALIFKVELLSIAN
jgi:FKBP-type peptidyl-prolyl cis-trans isomerase FkpA